MLSIIGDIMDIFCNSNLIVEQKKYVFKGWVGMGECADSMGKLFRLSQC